MPATIQKILKPSKYRAVDTSTSLQPTINVINDGVFNTDVAESTTGTFWITGDDCVISSGSATFTNDSGDSSGNCTQTNLAHALENGVTYRVTFTLSGFNQHGGSGGFRIKLHADAGTSAIGTTRKANGTYVEDLTITSSSSSAANQVIIQTYGDPMSGTIDNISVEKLESFGNNNHGQIYSGRALEFDGLSDYLTTGYTWADDTITICVWAKHVADDDSKTIFDTRNADDQGVLLRFGSGESIQFYIENSDITYSTYKFTGQWIRICAVYDKTNQKQTLYVNGVQVAENTSVDKSAIPDSAPTNGCTIGARAFSTADHFFNGMLSDVQAWNAAWSASDALYDYLNPESLALSNGGTSLTESNLKLWYPMQDGHRGQQSYIMDGANTGLGSEEVTEWNNNDFTSLSSTGTNITSAVSDGSANHEVYSNAINMTSGDTFKVTFTLGGTTGSNLKLHLSTNAHLGSADYMSYALSTGTYTLYINSHTTDSSMYFGFRSASSVCDFSVSNFSAKRVNDKHHATTVFFGEEMISTQANRQFGSSGQWVAYNGAAVDVNSTVSGKMHITFEGDGTSQGVQLPVANFTTPVAGRTYRIEADLDYISGADTDIKIKFCIAGTNDATCVVSAVDGTPNNGEITTTEEKYFSEVVATNSTGELLIICKTTENDNTSDPALITVDNVTVKEVGVARGWTDADQQLDIPQTALQSYNQLAWFPGSDSGTDYDVNCGSDSTIDDIFNGGGTISAWIYPTGDGTQWIVHKGSGTGPSSGWYVGVQNLSGGKFILRLDVSFDGTNGTWDTDDRVIPQGKWSHIAVKLNDDSTSNNASMYVNGEFVDVTESSTPVGTYNTDASADFLIGNSHDGTRAFGGIITEVSLWDKNLLLSEVVELYNDGMALDALTHSTANSNLKAYWRNNALAKWTDLKNTNHGTLTNINQTILFPAGVDASRCTQGFYMNRQKTTNSLNFYTPSYLETTTASNKESAYVFIPKAPLMTNSTAVTNFSICTWIKFHKTPNQENAEAVIYDDVQELHNRLQKGLRLSIGTGNQLKCDVWWGERNDDSNKDRVYCNYDLDNIDNATITNPHSFDANGMWNGTQTSMGTSKGIGYDAALMDSGSLPSKQWFHFAVTFDHDNSESQTSSIGDHTSNNATGITNEAPFYIYVNGILVGKEGIDDNDDQAVAENFDKTMMGVVDHPAILGSDMQSNLGQPGNNTNDIHGEIDDLLFYSDTLTSREVLRIYNAGKRSHR